MKWRFATVHSYRRRDQHPAQPLRSRFFAVTHFKTRTNRELKETMQIQQAMEDLFA